MLDLKRQKDERAIWDQIASQYDRRTLQTFEEAYRLTSEEIKEKITLTSEVLEIACGTGLISLAVAPFAGKFIGVDLSPEMLDLAQAKAEQSRLPNITFQEADAYNLPFDDESFDVVLAANMLHVVASPTAVMQEARRVLRSGGTLVTVTDCMAEPGPFKYHLYLFYLRSMKILGKIKYYHFYHKADLKDLMASNGFRIQKEAVFHTAPVNYYLTGKKG